MNDALGNNHAPLDAQGLSVAWLVNGTDGYGIQRATLTLIRGWQQAGGGASLVALTDGPVVDAARQEGIPVRVLGVGEAPAYPGGLIAKLKGVVAGRRFAKQLAPAVAEAAQAMSASVLHALTPSLVDLLGRAADLSGTTAVWEMPNYLGAGMAGINRRIYSHWIRRSRIQVLANSDYTGGTLVGPGLKPTLFHLGCDPSLFDPERVEPISRSELGLPDEAIVLGVVARLDPSKGQDRVLNAMLKLLEQRDAPMHLLLLGGPTDGPLAASLREQAQRAGHADRLHFTGTVPDPERYYPAIDLPINSRIDPEPFGLSVIEAMMMGRPILVHALGGPAETVIDGQTGWHLTDPSVEGWTAALRRALDDRTCWDTMGQQAHVHAMQHFSMAAQTQRYLDALRDWGMLS